MQQLASAQPLSTPMQHCVASNHCRLTQKEVRRPAYAEMCPIAVLQTNHSLPNILSQLLLSPCNHYIMVNAVKREMAEQQLRARQMVLQQQAASAVAAASKTQREVRLHVAPHGSLHWRKPCVAGAKKHCCQQQSFHHPVQERVPCARRCFCSCPSLADAPTPARPVPPSCCWCPRHACLPSLLWKPLHRSPPPAAWAGVP